MISGRLTPMADTLLAGGISQRFGDRVVLDRVDLEVPAGRVLDQLTWIQALAIFPFTSPMVMPSRIAIGASFGPEMALSLVLGAAAVLLALRVGSNIYSRAIVRTGRRLRLREVLA